MNSFVVEGSNSNSNSNGSRRRQPSPPWQEQQQKQQQTRHQYHYTSMPTNTNNARQKKTSISSLFLHPRLKAFTASSTSIKPQLRVGCCLIVLFVAIVGIVTVGYLDLFSSSSILLPNSVFNKEVKSSVTTMSSSSSSATSVVLQPTRVLLKVPSTDGVNDDKVEYFFQLPPTNVDNSFKDIKGIVLLFHGCTHDGFDWFTLPEERTIVTRLLSQEFAVISISSYDRINHKCWESNIHAERNHDISRILATLPQLWSYIDPTISTKQLNSVQHQQDDVSLMIESPAPRPPPAKLYAIGASSGGDFVSLLCRYIPMHGMLVMISPGQSQSWTYVSDIVARGEYGYLTVNDSGDGNSSSNDETVVVHGASNERGSSWEPRIVFVYMPRDVQYGSQSNIQQSVRILSQDQEQQQQDQQKQDDAMDKSKLHDPPSIIPIETFVCHPLPVTPSMLIDHIGSDNPPNWIGSNGRASPSAYLTLDEASLLVNALIDPLIDAIDSKTHLLKVDPRRIWSTIESLIHQHILQPRQQQQSNQDQDDSHDVLLIESIREVLNVAYGEHELTSEHIDDVIKFWLNIPLF